MEERCFIPPVAELSDSSGSNSEWLQKVGKKPSKRRRLGSLVRRRPKIDDTVQIQLMLSRNGKCKAGCRDPFRRNAGLKELIAFRQAWGAAAQVGPRPGGCLGGLFDTLFQVQIW